MGQNLVPLVNIKITGKWMFIPIKWYQYVLIHKKNEHWSYEYKMEYPDQAPLLLPEEPLSVDTLFAEKHIEAIGLSPISNTILYHIP